MPSDPREAALEDLFSVARQLQKKISIMKQTHELVEAEGGSRFRLAAIRDHQIRYEASLDNVLASVADLVAPTE